MQNLETLSGFHGSAGVDINDRGEVALNATSSPVQPGQPQVRVFLYSHGRMTDIGLPSGCSEAHASSLNNAGQIVGDCCLALGGTRPFLYDSRTKTMTILPVPPPYREGFAHHINDQGQVAGNVSTWMRLPTPPFGTAGG